MNANSPTKRQAILDAAKRVFLAEGYGRASMEAIAEAAPVSKPTLYSHFKGKQELFAAVILERCNDLLTTLAHVQAGHEDPVIGLKTIARGFVDFFYDPASLDLYRLIIAEQRHLPDLGDVVYRSSAFPIFQQLSAYLTELHADGVLHIPNVESASQLFSGMLQGHAHFRCLMGLQAGLNPAEKDALIETAVALFLRGYGYDA